MRKTIARLLIFLLPIVLVWACLEFFYRTVPNNYTVKYDYMQAHSGEVEVLLFGSSHSFFGLNPKYFTKKAYNLAGITQTLYFDKLLFDQYFDQTPNLKQVVFCIEYTNLSHRDDTHEDLFRKYYYENFMHLNVPMVLPLDPKKYSLAFTRNLAQSWEIIERYHTQGSIVDCDENGWGTTYKKMFRLSTRKLAAERAEAHEDESTDFSINKARLESIIARCKKRNVEVIIVSMPMSRHYTKLLDPNKLGLIVKTCEAFDAQHDNVRYLNLFNDSRFIDADFFDPDHLNDFGAVKSSAIVNAFLEKQ